MPDRLTTAEGIDRFSDELAAKLAKLRMSTDKVSEQATSDAPKLHLVTVFIALLSPCITVLGGGWFMTSYWRGQDATEKRFETIEIEQRTSRNERIDLKAVVEQIQRERSARIADLDQWRKGVEDELRVYRVALSEFRQLQGTVKEQGAALDRGRSERLADKDKVVDALSNLRTEVALLRQSLGAPGRRPEASPFGGENQMWMVPPPLQRSPDPLILRATYKGPAKVAERPRRVVRRRSIPFLVALFGPASKARRSAFLTRMR